MFYDSSPFQMSRLNKNMKIFVILLTSLLLVNCITKTIPPVAIPIPPPISESALKNLSKVKSGIAESISTNSKIDEKIKDQLKNVIDQKESIQDALDQAQKINDKVIAKQSITEQESFNLVTEIKKVKIRNLFLETQNIESLNLIKEQSLVLKITQVGADDTEVKLRNKEQEANQLREQNKFLGNNLNIKNIESEHLKKDLSKERIKSAQAGVYRNWILGLVGAFLLWIIVKNVISIYSPIKFRI